MEVEAVEEGTVAKLLVAAGSEGVKVNAPIAILLEDDEDESALEGYVAGGGSAPAAQPTPVPPAQAGVSSNESASPAAGNTIIREAMARASKPHPSPSASRQKQGSTSPLSLAPAPMAVL